MIVGRRPPASVRLGLSTRPRRATELGIATWARHADWVLLAVVGGLMVYSLDVIRIATRFNEFEDPRHFYDRQLLFIPAGILALLVVSCLDVDKLRKVGWWWLGISVGMLASVFALGSTSQGAQRWIELPGFQLQPSEFAKIAVILGAAAFLTDRADKSGDGSVTLGVLGYAALPAGLVFLQPDLGTALVFGAVAVGLLFLFGTRWTHFAGLAGGVGVMVLLVFVVAPSTGHPVLKPYQQDRLSVFLSPDDLDARAADAAARGDADTAQRTRDVKHQYDQALTAVGNGGLRGHGDNSTQVLGRFLPEAHTDFAFASLAEQRGFLGCLVAIGLYCLLIWRALRAVNIATSLYASLVAGGLAVMLLWQTFLNIGMNIGIMPITGVPLPLMSYGGSSMLTTMIAVGLIEAIIIRSRLAGPEERARQLLPAREPRH